jgi:hypothetical protein
LSGSLAKARALDHGRRSVKMGRSFQLLGAENVMARFCLLLLMLTLAVSPAYAEDNKPVGADQVLALLTVEKLAEIVRAKGFRAEIEPLPQPIPQLNPKTVLTGMSGLAVRIYLSGCEGEKGCAHVLYRAAFDNKIGVTAAELNKWNVARLHARAYLDPKNNIAFAMDMPLSGGVTMRAVAESATRFEILIGQFKSFPFRAGLPPGLPVQPAKPVENRT